MYMLILKCLFLVVHAKLVSIDSFYPYMGDWALVKTHKNILI